MSLPLIAALTALMVATSFLSGIFGMAGGLILMGVLLALLPVPETMALHAVTQMASNGWRGLLWWRYVRYRIVAFYLVGCLVALSVWAIWRWVPAKPIALLMLGATPFMARSLPSSLRPNPESPVQAIIYGAVCQSLMLLTGVSGPLLDSFFIGGTLDRREIVASKAVAQVAGHLSKLVYFTALVEGAASVDPKMALLAVAASMLGTSLARPVLERMKDQTYRLWANRIITLLASIYLAQGTWLLATGH